MAVPKRKLSRARRDRRRANWKLEAPNLVPCPHCRQAKLPHHVCLNCGHYAGRQAIEVD